MKRSKSVIFAISTLAALSSGTAARAAFVITDTKNFSFLPNGEQEMTFAKFDDQGGSRILQSVEISIELTKTGGSLAVDNDSATAGTINLSHEIRGNLNVVSGGISLLDLAFNPIGATIRANSAMNNVGIGATSGDSTSEFNNTGLGDYYLFVPSSLTVSSSGTINSFFTNNYVATGSSDNFVLNFAADQITSATGIGGLQQAYVVSGVQGNVTVKYNYDVIPEPTAAVLGVIGTAGLFLRRRRL